MAHGFSDEIVGIVAAIVSAFFASKAHRMAEGGPAPKLGEIAKGVTMQRLPKMFGIGRDDEQIFESLRQLVGAPKRHFVDLLLGEMHDYEADIFRLTVAGMPNGSEVVGDKTISWEFTTKDLRVHYLVDLADEVVARDVGLGEQVAASLVIAEMRSRRLITRSPSAQKAYELWGEATDWVKMNVLDFFGVKSFDEIRDDTVAMRIALSVDEIVCRHPETLSIRHTSLDVGGRVVIREELHARIPSLPSLMWSEAKKFFTFWR